MYIQVSYKHVCTCITVISFSMHAQIQDEMVADISSFIKSLPMLNKEVWQCYPPSSSSFSSSASFFSFFLAAHEDS